MNCRGETNSRKGNTGEFKICSGDAVKSHRVPKTGDDTHRDAKQQILRSAQSFHRLPAYLWESQIVSDTSSSPVLFSHWR